MNCRVVNPHLVSLKHFMAFCMILCFLYKSFSCLVTGLILIIPSTCVFTWLFSADGSTLCPQVALYAFFKNFTLTGFYFSALYMYGNVTLYPINRCNCYLSIKINIMQNFRKVDSSFLRSHSKQVKVCSMTNPKPAWTFGCVAN
jgi:hypothetical protein